MPASKKDNDGLMSDKIVKKERKKWKVISNYNSGVAEELERRPSKMDLDGLMSDKIAKKERKKRKVMSNYDSDVAEEVELDMPSSKKDNDGLMSDKIVKKERKKRKVTSNDDSVVAEGEQDRLPSKMDDDGLKSDKIARKGRKKQKVTSNYNSGVADEEEQDRPFAVNCEASTNVVSTSDKVAKKEKKKQKARAKYKDGDEHGEQDEQIIGVIEADTDDGLTSNKVAKKESKKLKTVRNYNGDAGIDQDGLLVCHTEANCTKQSKRKNKGGSEKYNDGESSNDAGNMDKKKKKSKSVDNGFNSVTPSKSSKKVSFSGHVDVFDIPSNSHVEKNNNQNVGLVLGKRFTPEENDTIKEAVYSYIADRDLGEMGLNMVLNSKKYSQLRGCWKEIGAALPHRPYTAVYLRAQVIFRRSEQRKWTQEEYDIVLKYQELHGNKWRALADELGKHRWHVKDTWRRIRWHNAKKGHWSQKEYQGLFDLVNTDLQLRIAEEKRSKHGMLRDNICWTAISEKLSTRHDAACCMKWYNQLTSPMVAEGVWADTDDYRLVDQLYKLDASCPEEVDWDNILHHRSGALCLKRWNQMVLHIGHHASKPFAEQVDALAQRYCPHLIQTREIWDSKPRVP